MNEDSYLNPADIKSQCSLAVSYLEKDNESIRAAENSLEAFIQEEEIKGDTFDALKQQLQDYTGIFQAARSANDSDIADFKTLSGAVGEEVLIGKNILSQQRTALRFEEEYLSMARENEARADSTKFFWMEAYYRLMAWRYRDFAEGSRKLYEKWKAKEEAYDSIETATAGLFLAGVGTRDAACSALCSLPGCFVGGKYFPDMDAAWRTQLYDSYINRVLSVSGEGKIVVDWREAEKILSREASEITSGEYDAIALAFLNTDEEGLGKLIQYMMGEKNDVNVPLINEVFGPWGGQQNEDYTEWNVDGSKMLEVRVRLAASGEALLPLIREAWENGEQERALTLTRQRDDTLQRLTLLSVASVQGTFRGEYKDAYPKITVTGGENGELCLQFCQYRNEGSMSAPMYSNLGNASITVGDTVLTSQIIETAINDAEYRFAGRFLGYSFAKEAAGFVAEEAAGEALGRGVEAVAGSLARSAGSKILEKAVGFIPLLGDVALFSAEAAQESTQEEADADFIKKEFEKLNVANFYMQFDCWVNFVEYDTVGLEGETVIWPYPGINTNKIIAGLNGGFHLELSIQDMLEDPNGTGNLLAPYKKDNEEQYDAIMQLRNNPDTDAESDGNGGAGR